MLMIHSKRNWRDGLVQGGENILVKKWKSTKENEKASRGQREVKRNHLENPAVKDIYIHPCSDWVGPWCYSLSIIYIFFNNVLVRVGLFPWKCKVV